MPTSINHLITSSFWLLCGVVGEAARVGHKFTEANVHRLFLFVPSWSMTRMLEACDRDKFDTHLQQYVDGLPQGDTIIEYRVDLKTGNWTALEPDPPPLGYPGNCKLDISTPFISTLDSARLLYLMDSVQKRAAPITGGSGTAHTYADMPVH